jgi:hypothetical protein
MTQRSAFSRGRFPLSPHARWLNARNNLRQFSLPAIFLASAIKSAPHALLLSEDLDDAREGKQALQQHTSPFPVPPISSQVKLREVGCSKACLSSPAKTFEIRYPELAAALDGTVILLSGRIEQTFIPVFPHPLINHGACKGEVL